VNRLAFIAAIVGSLAWPVTLIVIVLIFRRQLLAAAPWLRELEVGNVKLKFAEELAKATTAAEEMEPQNRPASTAPTVTDRDMLLAEHAPIALVLQSWLAVENALADAAMRHGLSTSSGTPRAVPAFRLIEDLEARRVITPATAQTLSYLRQLRNQVAHHKGSIDTDQALEYARLANKVVDALDDAPTPIRGLPSTPAPS
jgi:Domain of unknown function (DUF4145)